MGFKITMEIDADLAPDAVGEYLRASFFSGEYGCYSSFDWREDVEPLPQLAVDDYEDGEPDFFWTRARKNNIECRYYWDGDGVLAFGLPDGQWLVNYDCKKDHGWTVVANEREIC